MPTAPLSDVPESVLEAFPLGLVRSATPITHGLIHRTYRIDAESGIFVLQRLHPVLSSDAVAEDFAAVTAYLSQQGFPAPRCVRTRAGGVLHRSDGFPWRLQTFVDGQTVHQADAVRARSAGALYARFHAVMADCPHVFQTTRVLHDTPRVLATLRTVWDTPDAQALRDQVGEAVDEVLERLPALLLPPTVTHGVIHGDPKISNVLFHAGGEAAALVDLDTCSRRPFLVELGDAFRSWCGLAEDAPDNRFRRDVFEAGWTGYRSASTGLLPADEVERVPEAVELITLELTARFLTDVVTDDYFGWDAARYPSRRAHNLARARGQLALARDVRRQAPSLETWIRAQTC